MAPLDTMERTKDGLDELTQEIRRVIEDNRKFLERVMDEGFEDEGQPDEEEFPEEEL